MDSVLKRMNSVFKMTNFVLSKIYRTPAEAALMLKFGAQLISVDADVTTRYNRTVMRGSGSVVRGLEYRPPHSRGEGVHVLVEWGG